MSAVLLLAVLTVTSSCGPKRVTVDGQDMSYEQGSEYLYRLGHQAQDAGDLTNAKKRYRDLVNDFDSAKETIEGAAAGQLSPVRDAGTNSFLTAVR